MNLGTATFKGHLVLHLIMVIFLGFPAFITSIFPATWIRLCRNGEHVSLEAKTYLLFVIPFQELELEAVSSAEAKIKPGRLQTWEGGESPITGFSEPIGSVNLQGQDNEVKLLVDPVDVRNVANQINRFLVDPSQSRISFYTLANRKVSLACGIWAGFFLAIYLVYLLSWLVPHSIQWRMLEWFLKKIPAKWSGPLSKEIQAEAARSGMTLPSDP